MATLGDFPERVPLNPLLTAEWEHEGLKKQRWLIDVPDLQGLLAPLPLLIDIGAYDSCFHVDTAMKCYHSVEKIYQAARCSDLLELDLFPGEHGWDGNKSKTFFKKYLS